MNSESDARIMATGQYFLTADYSRSIAERVHQAVEAQGDMDYRVILNAAHGERNAARLDTFVKFGIPEKIRYKFVDHPWPFDVLIGGNSVMLALPYEIEECSYMAAVKIDDQKFVGCARMWFEKVLWLQAKAGSINPAKSPNPIGGADS